MKATIITDDKLLELGFQKSIISYDKDGYNIKAFLFEMEYNYYLKNKQRIVLERIEGGKFKFPQFEGFYSLSIRSGNKNIERLTTILSNTNDLNRLKNIIKGLI